MSQRITIVHSNDFHNHLTPGQGQTLRLAKIEAGANALLVDAGDAVSAGNVGVRPAGEPILKLMSDVGYDAMTMGNREFHISDAILRHKIANARFPVLCANVRYRNAAGVGARAMPTVPFIVRALPGGVRVGIIGVTVPMVTERNAARHLSAFIFDDPVEVASRMAAQLRSSVDVLIALTHIGIKSDERLSNCSPDFDLIVSGHTHLTINASDRAAGVPIVQAGWFGRQYGVVDLELDDGRPRVVRSQILSLEPASTTWT